MSKSEVRAPPALHLLIACAEEVTKERRQKQRRGHQPDGRPASQRPKRPAKHGGRHFRLSSFFVEPLSFLEPALRTRMTRPAMRRPRNAKAANSAWPPAATAAPPSNETSSISYLTELPASAGRCLLLLK